MSRSIQACRGLAGKGREPHVFVFNPFAEGYIARGKGFAPVKHQAQLSVDLENLPQFLCEPQDIVLVRRRPCEQFLATLQEAGFASPLFVEMGNEGLSPAHAALKRPIAGLRPWAWGPDSLELLSPLFPNLPGPRRDGSAFFNARIAGLYAKGWASEFLRECLKDLTPMKGDAGPGNFLCSEEECGVLAGTVSEALAAVEAIRKRGHHRVVVKQNFGLAGHNAIRLWEAQLLPAQRQWLERSLEKGGAVVVEPWLERVADFSVQLEMETGGLKLCGYTSLLNDLKGQYIANWAEPGFEGKLPGRALGLLHAEVNDTAFRRLQDLYGHIFFRLGQELRGIGFLGPVSLDALIYHHADGRHLLKPIVELNPRHTMGRLTLELMRHVAHGSCGLFRLTTSLQARAGGFANLGAYAAYLAREHPPAFEDSPTQRIKRGMICLNDPSSAKACLATFQVAPGLEMPLISAANSNAGWSANL